MNVSPTNAGTLIINGSPAPAYPYTYRFWRQHGGEIKAVGANGYAFAYWTGCISGSVNPTEIIVNQTRSVTAIFTLAPTMASIGGFIWDDADADGIQDSGEFGLDGRLIYLLDANGLFLASTATVDGTFVFSDLDAGDYLLYVVASEGTVFTSRDQGSDDSIDSDCNPRGYRTSLPSVRVRWTSRSVPVFTHTHHYTKILPPWKLNSL